MSSASVLAVPPEIVRSWIRLLYSRRSSSFLTESRAFEHFAICFLFKKPSGYFWIFDNGTLNKVNCSVPPPPHHPCDALRMCRQFKGSWPHVGRAYFFPVSRFWTTKQCRRGAHQSPMWERTFASCFSFRYWTERRYRHQSFFTVLSFRHF